MMKLTLTIDAAAIDDERRLRLLYAITPLSDADIFAMLAYLRSMPPLRRRAAARLMPRRRRGDIFAIITPLYLKNATLRVMRCRDTPYYADICLFAEMPRRHFDADAADALIT